MVTTRKAASPSALGTKSGAVSKDLAKAISLCKRACDLGDKHACDAVTLMREPPKP